MYDIIGDVHGHARLLKKMLVKLGYEKRGKGFTHNNRKVIFTGDFINRGPDIRKTIRIVRNMVENGNAFAILGNHEINSIIASLKDKKGLPLVKPPLKSYMSVLKTTKEFTDAEEEWAGHVKWLRSLPLFLEFDGLRVIHACWSDSAVSYLKNNLTFPYIKKSVFQKVFKKPDSKMAKIISLITRGPHFRLPGDLKIINNKGVSPRSFRLKWWEDPFGKTFEDLSFESKFGLPQYTVPQQILPKTYPYAESEPVLFIGHYCRFKGPFILSKNLCCVDSCVNGSKILTAYSWDGERELSEEKLIQVSYVID